MSHVDLQIDVDAVPIPTIVINAPSGVPGPAGPVGPEGPPGLDGKDGLDGSPGGTMVSGNWGYAVATTPPPASGQIRTTPDLPVVGLTYTIYLHTSDIDGLVWSGVINPGDTVRLRGSNGATQECIVQDFIDMGAYAEINTILDASSGMLVKNTTVRVDLIRAAPSGGTVEPLEWLPYPLNAAWRSYPAVTGDNTYDGPEYAVDTDKGIGYLRGVLDGQNSVAGDFPAPLPAEAWPTKKQRLILATNSGIQTYDMCADGVLREPSGSLGVRAFIVLNSVYFL